ncbi:MAG: Y-family DNA polymerase [Caulobacteraceae bacterium]
MARILCVWSPSWAIANWRRRNPSVSPAESSAPFALIAADRGVRRLFAVDEKAADLGLYAGQKATDAAALVPELVTAEAEPAADHAALIALGEWCVRFSPAAAPVPPDGLFLDVTGIAHLWGSEAAMGRDLIFRLAKAGVPARFAIAGTAGAAFALAHYAPALHGAPGTIAESGSEAEALAPLPVAALRLDPEAARQIARLGLAVIGDLAVLPRDQITRRFTGEVVSRLDQALGRAPEALAFRRPPNPWFARLALVEPISTPEVLARVTLDIAVVLCARLEREGKGATRFELCFHRLDGRPQGLAIGLALAGRDPKRIARLFGPHLETVDPGFGIELVTLAAEEVERLCERTGRLDQDRDLAGEGIAPLVDRISNRLGQTRVWRDEAWPSHLPERAIARRPPLAAAGGSGWDAERPRPLRLFRRPEPIEAVAPVPDDPPVLFRWRGGAHKVRRAEGPERLAAEWWRAPFEQASPARVRDYYQVEDEAGARFWVFRAGLYEAEKPAKWWLHGLFG